MYQYKTKVSPPVPTVTPTLNYPTGEWEPTIEVTTEVPTTVIPTFTPTPTPDDSIVIRSGGTARVQCGQGSDGTKVIFFDHPANVGLGDKVGFSAEVRNVNNELAGGLIEWRLYYRGSLKIKDCTVTFIAPDSIGTAYSTSVDITAKIASAEVSPGPTSGGEGGPRFVVAPTKTSITIIAGGAFTCFDPAGVAVSINSVPTTDAVQIAVDTPRFLDRNFFSRVATVRDGVGTYYIQIFVNGGLYGQTTSQVGECQLSTVKF